MLPKYGRAGPSRGAYDAKAQTRTAKKPARPVKMLVSGIIPKFKVPLVIPR